MVDGEIGRASQPLQPASSRACGKMIIERVGAVNRKWLLLAAATARRLPLKPRAAEQEEEEKRKVEEKDQNGWA